MDSNASHLFCDPQHFPVVLNKDVTITSTIYNYVHIHGKLGTVPVQLNSEHLLQVVCGRKSLVNSKQSVY